ncbi:MAG: hypothetical protein J0H15_08900 [Xanthomonadales bacterium]|nr:hypothetical protein [Xanthomonadales bacterium]
MRDPDFTGVFRPRAAIVSALFGTMWLLAWWYQAHRASLAVLLGILGSAMLVMGAALFQLRRFRRAELAAPPGYRRSRLRLYAMVNAIYWPILFIAVAAIGASGHARWINPAIILLVGLHLFPLGLIFRDRLLHLAGVLLVALAVCYPAVADPGSPLGLLGAGAILLATGAAAVVINTPCGPAPLIGAGNRDAA